MLAFLRSFDIFGHHIGVTYKGDSTLKTGLGAFVTLAYYILALVNLGELIA